jgi:hypothetical protein
MKIHPSSHNRPQLKTNTKDVPGHSRIPGSIGKKPRDSNLPSGLNSRQEPLPSPSVQRPQTNREQWNSHTNQVASLPTLSTRLAQIPHPFQVVTTETDFPGHWLRRAPRPILMARPPAISAPSRYLARRRLRQFFSQLEKSQSLGENGLEFVWIRRPQKPRPKILSHIPGDV